MSPAATVSKDVQIVTGRVAPLMTAHDHDHIKLTPGRISYDIAWLRATPEDWLVWLELTEGDAVSTVEDTVTLHCNVVADAEDQQERITDFVTEQISILANAM
jgi:hypothetical protein